MLSTHCFPHTRSIAIGFNDTHLCDGQGSVMEMSTFAIASGFIGIAIALVSTASALCVCSKRSDPRGVQKQALWLLLSASVFCAVSIVGFVEWTSCPAACKMSARGNVVLAWCIIRVIGGCCGCVQGAIAMKRGHRYSPVDTEV